MPVQFWMAVSRGAAYLHPEPVLTSTPQEGTLHALWCDQRSASPPSSWRRLSSCTPAKTKQLFSRMILISFDPASYRCSHWTATVNSHAGVPDDAALVHLLADAMHHKHNVGSFRWGVLWCCLLHIPPMETGPAAGGWGHERTHHYLRWCVPQQCVWCHWWLWQIYSLV